MDEVLELTDIINIILAVLSFLLAAISIITVVITIKQNNRMLEANERPYVVAYLIYEEYSTNIYFCVRNFGHASAKIENFNMLPDIKIKDKNCSDILKNTVIAPGQQLHFIIPFPEKDKILKEAKYVYAVKLAYVDCTTRKHYEEEYEINLGYITEVLSSRSTGSNRSEIENSLRNIEKAIAFIKNQTF